MKQLVHGDVGPLLKSLYERSHFRSNDPSEESSMQQEEDEHEKDSSFCDIDRIASSVMLLICTHLAQLLQMTGVLDSRGTRQRSTMHQGLRVNSSTQREFVEKIAVEAVTELAKLNMPIDVSSCAIKCYNILVTWMWMDICRCWRHT